MAHKRSAADDDQDEQLTRPAAPAARAAELHDDDDGCTTWREVAAASEVGASAAALRPARPLDQRQRPLFLDAAKTYFVSIENDEDLFYMEWQEKDQYKPGRTAADIAHRALCGEQRLRLFSARQDRLAAEYGCCQVLCCDGVDVRFENWIWSHFIDYDQSKTAGWERVDAADLQRCEDQRMKRARWTVLTGKEPPDADDTDNDDDDYEDASSAASSSQGDDDD